MDRNRILNKVKKLLAISEDQSPTNVHQAAAAAAMAQEILLRHKLTMTDVQDAEEKQILEQVLEHDLNMPKGIREIPEWKRWLAGVLAENNFCWCLATPRGLRFVGAEEDLAFVAWLYGYLTATLERLGAEAWEQNKDRHRRNLVLLGVPHAETNRSIGRTWKNSFYLGACQSLKDRLEQQRKDTEQKAVLERRKKMREEADQAWRSGGLGWQSRMVRYQNESWEKSLELALAPFKEAEARVREFVDRKYPDRTENGFVFQREEDPFQLGQRTGRKIALNKPLKAGSMN